MARYTDHGYTMNRIERWIDCNCYALRWLLRQTAIGDCYGSDDSDLETELLANVERITATRSLFTLVRLHIYVAWLQWRNNV